MAFIDRLYQKLIGKVVVLHGVIFQFAASNNIANAHRIAPVSATELGYYINGTLYFTFSATAFSFPSGTAAAPSITFTADPDTGWFRLAANQVALALGGVLGLAAFAGFGIKSVQAVAADNTAGTNVTLTASKAGGSATAARAGGAFSILGGDGSAGSEGTGTVDAGTGGVARMKAGDGGLASSTAGAQGGAGGAADVLAGDGGSAAGTDPGGAGGAVAITSGVGGAKTGTGTANGGAGGAVSVTGSAGGATEATAGTAYGGAGADVSVTAGAGGAASAGTANGGDGGTVRITPGVGGTSAGGTAGKDGVIILRGAHLVKQGAPTAKTTSATLTAAEVLAGIITVNQGGGGASAQQLPTCADLDAALPDAAAGDAFDFTVVNTSTVDAEDASVTTNTGWTLVGSMDVHAYSAAGSLNSSGRFRARKTGSATWTLYRIS